MFSFMCVFPLTIGMYEYFQMRMWPLRVCVYATVSANVIYPTESVESDSKWLYRETNAT